MANAYHTMLYPELGTSGTLIFDVSAAGGAATNEYIIKELRFTNRASTDITVDCYLWDGANNNYLGKDIVVPVGSSINLVDSVLVLNFDDDYDMYAVCDTVDGCDIIASYMLIS